MSHRSRSLLAEVEPSSPPLWQTIYASLVLAAMFLALFSDRFGSDAVMMVTLTAMLVPGVISVQEALDGFSNSGLWTVMVLFIIAEAISKTGAFGWYMTKLLGLPKTIASAQLRLMLPITAISAFLNNTPIVVVMIPIVQQWAENARIDVQQLLIPLSWAAILGGTITLIGTSTNLVINGLLEDMYPNAPRVGMFELTLYGLPNAFVGLSYILLMSPFILGRSGKTVASIEEPILLGARLTPWSPAAGRSVQRSNLRDTGGIYLVSVVRAHTGHVHRAVSGDFVLNVGDTLYFTGLVESFGAFCSEHGLEVVTNETIEMNESIFERDDEAENDDAATIESPLENTTAMSPENLTGSSAPSVDLPIDVPLGVTKESLLLASRSDRLRCLSILTDLIRGYQPPAEYEATPLTSRVERPAQGSDPPQIVAAEQNDVVGVGINCCDRPGLLLDISRGLLRLNLQLRNTEAAVVGERSISVWRCEQMRSEESLHFNLEEVWSVLHSLLSSENGIYVMKQRGLRVLRARVTKRSRLIDRTASEVEFRALYRAAIVAVRQQSGSNDCSREATSIRFQEGDVLILQVSDDSPLLIQPPPDFYQAKDTPTSGRNQRVPSRFVNSSVRNAHVDEELSGEDSDSVVQGSVVESVFFDAETGNANTQDISRAQEQAREVERAVWSDLEVLSRCPSNDFESDRVAAAPEFLTATRISQNAGWIGKTAKQVGLHNLPNLVLVSIEREAYESEHPYPNLTDAHVSSDQHKFETLDHDTPLGAGYILWFSGPAKTIGDLRRIPGLESYEHKEVNKVKERLNERRLVQAVISRNGPLVGKTVKEARFRTRYGAAVISVQREGKRVHELPGMVKLQAGDVLLLEAGKSFLGQSPQNESAFALLAEVKDSSPPRLRLLIPTLLITAAALAVYIAQLTTLLCSMLVASILLILLGVISEQEARDSLNWAVYVTIGAAFGIGAGLVNSGVAGGIADFLVKIGVGVGIGDAGVIAGVYITTVLIGNVLTNNATAALVFPIAMNAANQIGTPPNLMAFALMLAASANFMSPYAYTTNLLIFGPGKYKYSDFLLFGVPLQIVLWLSASAILSVKPWYGSWVVTASMFFVVAFIRVFSAGLLSSIGRSDNKRQAKRSNGSGARP